MDKQKAIEKISWAIMNKAATISGAVSSIIMLWGFLGGVHISQILVMGILAFAGLLYVLKEIRNHDLKFPRRDTREDREYNVLDTYFSKKSIRIIDFIDNQEQKYVIYDKVFEDCVIYGPCIVGVTDSGVIEYCTFGSFNNDIETALYEISDRFLIGAVGFSGCTFRRCIFRGVGFAGPKSFLDKIRNNTSTE